LNENRKQEAKEKYIRMFVYHF